MLANEDVIDHMIFPPAPFPPYKYFGYEKLRHSFCSYELLTRKLVYANPSRERQIHKRSNGRPHEPG